MTLKFIISVAAIVALPFCAQAQQPQGAPPAPKAAPTPTKADAQKVIKIVSSDKAKTKIYCDISALGDQIDEAVQKKDEKKIDELSQKADEMGAKIGPEYVALMDGMQELDPDSKEGKDLSAMLEQLENLCGK
ncbi:MAG: hypothetical protein WDN48_14305 [Pseudolabrys sp.]